MKLTHIGHACFLIEGEEQSFVIDPYESSIGIEMPWLTADYLLISHEHYDHNNRAAVEAKYPNEAPPNVKIVDSFHDDQGGALRGANKIHIIDVDGQKVCHLGDLGHTLTDEKVAQIDKVDTLLVPVGGTYTIDAHGAITVCKQLKPKIIIPMHYKTPGVNLDIAPVDEFAQLAKENNLPVTILDPGGLLTQN
ncbi:MAG: MBL fold metallo-hydrolase [Candidatus Nomurabacteria bacterium]|jgi:L-ascorbate metabolism protein UlaG (beta-lactamase superfamily)|nr:MBL fold metallo-hydrolase [Candidatus Nomurabacteria bacterium]